jgi:hypothetical protein
MSGGALRVAVISYFCILLLLSLLYVGFAGALWLRGLTPTTSALALALGRQDLPNLVSMSFICSLGVLGEWRINAAVLPTAAQAVVYVLNVTRIATGLVLISTFFGGYSADITRAENLKAPPGGEGA